MIIVNADDWGRSIADTKAALACYERGSITSVSAMVFMADSERAAGIALERNIPTGLHTNFNEMFSGPVVESRLRSDHQRVGRFLSRSRFSQLFYNPFLRKAFQRVFLAQYDEFLRLYGKPPTHFDGHRHMHLCVNMLVAAPIPRGQKVRRSFSFERGEKSFGNRMYRALIDRWLLSRYRATDYFFSLFEQLTEKRFARVCSLALKANVEVMTHPVVQAEQDFLKSERYTDALRGVPRGSYADL
jgi:predicted glycoside hydrolase/deacetylase ChbG (UPF0249 family)